MANLDLPALVSLRELADDSHVRSRFLRTWIIVLIAHLALIALLFKLLLPQLERFQAREAARDFAPQEVNWIATAELSSPPATTAPDSPSATAAPETRSKPILYADSADPQRDPESDIALPIRQPEPQIAPSPVPPAPETVPAPAPQPKLTPAPAPEKTTPPPEPKAQPTPARPRLAPAPAPKTVPAAKPLPKLSPAPEPVRTPAPTPKPVVKPAPTPKPVVKATPAPAPAKSTRQPALKPAPAPIPKARPVVAAQPAPASRTAKPTVLAPAGPAPAKTVPGPATRASTGEKEDLSWYHKLIHDAFHGNWRQPQSVQTGGKIYSSKMKIVIRRDGTIAHTSMVKPSGNEVMDLSVTTAAAAVRRIAPLPKSITSDTYTVYINFELK